MSPPQTHQSIHSRETVSLGRLREILLSRRGERNAVRGRDLVVLLGLGQRDSHPERSIREAIGIFIRESTAIGSTVGETPGYFVIQTEKELRRCCANYVARAKAIQDKAEALVAAFRRGPAEPGLDLEPSR